MKLDTNNYIELENVARILKVKTSKILNQLKSLNLIPLNSNNKILITEQQFMTLKNHYYPHFNLKKLIQELH